MDDETLQRWLDDVPFHEQLGRMTIEQLDEILSLSDRILVIYEGRIVGQYGPDVSEETLGIAMTGGDATGEAAA